MARELRRTIRHCLWAGDLHPHEAGNTVHHVAWAEILRKRLQS